MHAFLVFEKNQNFICTSFEWSLLITGGLVIGSSLTLCEQRIDKNQEKLFLTASDNLEKILCQSISEFQHLKA